MGKPKITHVINSIGLGGVPEAVYHLLRTLPAERYDCNLYVLRAATDEREAREGRLDRFRELGVPVVFPERDEQKMAVVGDLARWIMGERIDILHTHSYKPNLYGRLAGLLCKHTGLKIVGHYHNQYDNKWEADGGLIFDRLLAHSSERLVAVSESVRQHVAERMRIPAEPITVILNGVEAERFAGRDRVQSRAAFDLPQGQPVVGMVGRISEQKGQGDFIRAAQLLRREFPDALFLVVGSADEAAQLARMQALVADLGLGSAVRFTGHVSDIPAIYAALDVLAAPSRWEGFGLMLVEAMAAGTPIVATRVGAIPEVVVEGETALLVPPADPAAIAEAVGALLRDPARRQAMGRRGVGRAREFSWHSAGRRLDALYAQLLGATPP